MRTLTVDETLAALRALPRETLLTAARTTEADCARLALETDDLVWGSLCAGDGQRSPSAAALRDLLGAGDPDVDDPEEDDAPETAVADDVADAAACRVHAAAKNVTDITSTSGAWRWCPRAS